MGKCRILFFAFFTLMVLAIANAASPTTKQPVTTSTATTIKTSVKSATTTVKSTTLSSTSTIDLKATTTNDTDDFDAASIPVEGGKIVGGVPVHIASFPYQLSLRLDGSHICGASLITRTYALTAAHCSQSEASAMSLRAGSSDRTMGGQVYYVAKKIVHPSFDPVTYDYDFTLLQTSVPVTLSRFVKTIQLPPNALTIPANTLVFVSGWGTTYSGANDIPNNLRAVKVPIVSNANCNNAYGSGSITSRMMCAGYNRGGKDSCQGDSGGPLAIQFGGRRHLIGVVSWGNGCALRNYPGVYSNVSSMLPWIWSNAV